MTPHQPLHNTCVSEDHVLHGAGLSRRKRARGRGRSRTRERMRRPYGERIQRNRHTAALVVERGSELIDAVAIAVSEERTAIEKVIAVEAHRGVDHRSGGVAGQDPAAHIAVEGRKWRERTDAVGGHREVSDLRDFVLTKPNQGFRRQLNQSVGGGGGSGAAYLLRS